MPLLIGDANVLIDMEVGGLLERMFALPHEFATPDALYADELALATQDHSPPPPPDGESNEAAFLATAMDNLNQEALRSTIREAVEARGIAQLAQETGLPRREIENALTPGGRPACDAVVTRLQAVGCQVRVEPPRSGRPTPVA
ncbi:hypothetical protein [Aquisalimonas sp.]|uniref:hypothetical protein n=1 Tax=Aquisalimonas sp. TaxID=1872621 RepID=UPI0025B9BE53|nr:hypothetical protein [Aquisalimonas sp.]